MNDAVIDPRAIIAPQAQIAADVAIGPYSIIGRDVAIGRGTWIGPHVVINGPTSIGADNKIFQFASLGDAPQDKKYRGEPTRLEVGDRNVFRESVTVNRGTAHGAGVTRIGNDNLFMAYSHVAHDCRLGDQIVLANCATLGGHVEIGDWVIMGGLSAVHQFTKVGAHCFLAHNAAVTRDVPPYVMAVGRPAVPAQREFRGPEAPRLHRRADPQHSARLPRAVSFGVETAHGDRGVGAGRRNPSGDPALRRIHQAQLAQHRSVGG